ncbi:transcriptional regulator [Alsobacter soli]|uniref:Transcriptional regulator n=1 Tax=Alsobacter soli TaxID=2109933 RepID=A0A2T1HYK9_9HYPH|nr:MucR family transcriptional regulator [Alsobacter soli]PSC06680.1 transcriptional regulator [Alsobacter soli]
MSEHSTAVIDLVADIVSAYVANNKLTRDELTTLIGSVHNALASVSGAPVEEPVEELRPAVPIKKSVTPDYIVCLEDGKTFKSLKRHLSTKYGMTPAEYRARWGLPSDYPMVAPNYAASRSQLAKSMGLGQARRKPAPAPQPAPAKRGRKPKAAAE